MFGALLHDVGQARDHRDARTAACARPTTTCAASSSSTRFLERMRAPNELVARVGALVEHHLAPALFIKNGATAKGYRRLARKLARVRRDGGAARARRARRSLRPHDRGGARARAFPPATSSSHARASSRSRSPPPRDVVLGRHLIARGLRPGPEFGAILERCREMQDETGSTDPEQILERVLGQR